MSTLTALLLASLGLVSASEINPRDSIAIPAECDVIPTWEVTDFNWFNSSQNLDCVNQVNVPNVCFNESSSGFTTACDSNLEPCQICGVPGCNTGLPLQPAGYGPPDSVTISIPSVLGYDDCQETNPQTIRRYEVGDGIVLCGGVAYHINFFGDSNEATSTAHIDFAPVGSWTCSNGSTISASGSVDFEIACTRDAQNNATCVIPADEVVVIPVLSYEIQ